MPGGSLRPRLSGALMNQIARIVLLTFVVLASSEHGMPNVGDDPPPRLCELYSWPSETGSGWEFALLSGETSRKKTPREVLDAKRSLKGLDALALALDSLPKGSTIVWIEGLYSVQRDPATGRLVDGAPVKGAERLSLPSDEIREEVRSIARDRSITLEIGTSGRR